MCWIALAVLLGAVVIALALETRRVEGQSPACPPGYRFGGIVPDHGFEDCCVCWLCIAPDGTEEIFIDFKEHWRGGGNTPVPPTATSIPSPVASTATPGPPKWAKSTNIPPKPTATASATASAPKATEAISSATEQPPAVTPANQPTKSGRLTPTPTPTATPTAIATPSDLASRIMACVPAHGGRPLALCETGSGSGWWLHWVGDEGVRPGPYLPFPAEILAGDVARMVNELSGAPVAVFWGRNFVRIRTFDRHGKLWDVKVYRDGTVEVLSW